MTLDSGTAEEQAGRGRVREGDDDEHEGEQEGSDVQHAVNPTVVSGQIERGDGGAAAEP